ncbi:MULTISPECIES: NBR1-Ig-like domain-containing protein [Pseudoalteromonas]|nr:MULTISPECIES: NBR1-Ig-like domain-containing protein [Pseudoalteromonas]
MQMKQVIYDCQCSQSHFYKVLAGKRPLNEHIRKYLAQLLSVSEEELEDLICNKSTVRKEAPHYASKVTKNHKAITWKRTLITIIFLSVLLLSYLFEDIKPLVVESRYSTNSEIQDIPIFVKDVTIPDGTAIPVNTEFVKIWRIKNGGGVMWSGRYLQRMTIASQGLCQSPNRIPIPETAPGEVIDLEVTFKTPSLPGSCRTDWKMVDDRGKLIYPTLSGLYSIVQVVQIQQRAYDKTH